MTVGRVSEAAVEALLQSTPNAKLGQQTTELLLRQLPRARLGHLAVEMLRSTGYAGGATMTQPVIIMCVSA